MNKSEGFTVPKHNMMLLLRETREGLQMAGRATYILKLLCIKSQLHSAVCSLTELIPKLLAIPGVSCVLTARFCHDLLESYFGKQRYKGRWNENPSVKEYLDNAVFLRVQSSAALAPLRGNCTKRIVTPNIKVDNIPLPK